MIPKKQIYGLAVSVVTLSAVALLFSKPLLAADEDQAMLDRLYDSYGIELSGFTETRWGARVVDDTTEKDMSIGEARVQLEMSRDFDSFVFKFKGDLLADAVMEEADADIRDLSLMFSPTDSMDVKIGRMVSTWGTGDLVFINDMFPKDWQSFFIGRDDEYLKQASNIIKTSIFIGDYALDLVYTPLFQGSEFVKGERLSFYNPMAGQIVGREMIIENSEHNRYFSDAEMAGRLSTSVGGVEVALYGYAGFWQEPEGFDPVSGKVVSPRLNVWGGSARSPMLGGIANIEVGYYDSYQSDESRDPFGKPSEYHFLAGFERELAHELTGGFQYYLEIIDDYDNYEQAVLTGMPTRDEFRHMLTMRLTKLLMNQNLNLSLFVYYSPTDNDGYLRPKFSYKLNDNWLLDGGFNLFWGEEEYTFWGRFQDNSNGFVGLRYSF